MTSIDKICEKFGGKPTVAAILGLTKGAPYQWRGYIPTKYHLKLIEEGRQRQINISHAELCSNEEP
jgi:hypothetical protein